MSDATVTSLWMLTSAANSPLVVANEITALLWPLREPWLVCVGVSVVWLMLMENPWTSELKLDCRRGLNGFHPVTPVKTQPILQHELQWLLSFRWWIIELWCCIERPEHTRGTPCCTHSYKVSLGNKEYEFLCGCINCIWSLANVHF